MIAINNDPVVRIADLADEYGITPADVCSRKDLLGDEVTDLVRHKAFAFWRDRIDGTISQLNDRFNGTALAEEVKEKTTKRTKEKKDGTTSRKICRCDIFGHPVTAVLRWMGREGWEFEDALTAVVTMGASTISDVTIRLQLAAGRKGERGEPADITSAQAKILIENSK